MVAAGMDEGYIKLLFADKGRHGWCLYLMTLVVLHFLRLLQLIPYYGTGVPLVPNIRRVDERFGGNELRYE